ncbi:MAG: hypothetical protein HKN24_13130, partial [Acidimicrobiales bacterium]|nr:hypothetical protein [Acidimicrobiales bacterium]
MTRPSLLANLTEERAVLEAALRLVALPSLGVARCRWLLDAVAAPVVVENLLRGRLPKHLPSPLVPVRAEHVDKWRDQLRDQDVSQLVSRNL